MLEKIINGISNQLFNVFGADYKIYADNKVQQVKCTPKVGQIKFNFRRCIFYVVMFG